MNWLDGVLLLALVWSALTGVRRGLTFELLSLASWLAALLAAHVFGELVGMLLPWSMPAAVQYAVGFVIVLLGVRLVLVALALGLKALVQDSVLGGVDRGLGGLFGMARGVLLLGLLALGVTLTPLRDEPVWKASVAGAWLTEGVQAARPWISPHLQSLWPKEVPGERGAGFVFV
jgi:membrane protein required for colicin V production